MGQKLKKELNSLSLAQYSSVAESGHRTTAGQQKKMNRLSEKIAEVENELKKLGDATVEVYIRDVHDRIHPCETVKKSDKQITVLCGGTRCRLERQPIDSGGWVDHYSGIRFFSRHNIYCGLANRLEMLQEQLETIE